MRYYSEKTVRNIIKWICPGVYFNDDVNDRIKRAKHINYPEKPTDSPWHTGTPTEDGNYLCHYRFKTEEYDDPDFGYDLLFEFKNGSWVGLDCDAEIVAWFGMPIPPFKASKESKC